MADLHILTIFLLALSSNLDNIGVGTSYGARGINIPFSSNLLIAVITGAGTFVSMTIGNGISNIINPILQTLWAHFLLEARGFGSLSKSFCVVMRKKVTSPSLFKKPISPINRFSERRL